MRTVTIKKEELRLTGWICSWFACLMFRAISLPAQTLPPVSPERLSLAADRIEAVTILGGAHGVGGGAYKLGGDNPANLNVTKLGGAGDLTAPRPLGLGNLKWNPTGAFNLGWISADMPLRQPPLKDNTIRANTLGIEFGGGARFWFNKHLSVAPQVSAIYSHVKDSFNITNANGLQYADAMAKAGWVNWSTDAWTWVPAAEMQYLWNWNRTEFDFTSTYKYFHTNSFNSSSPLVNVHGSSQAWSNEVDVDVPLGWKTKDREWHTGGSFRITEIFGNIRTGFNASYIAVANGRFVLDSLGKRFKLGWLGVGYTYFKGENFSGWSIGIDTRLRR
jgi:hypothetical protein